MIFYADIQNCGLMSKNKREQQHVKIENYQFTRSLQDKLMQDKRSKFLIKLITGAK